MTSQLEKNLKLVEEKLGFLRIKNGTGGTNFTSSVLPMEIIKLK